MTLGKFKTANPGVLLDEPSWDELAAMANGAVLFHASLAGTKAPKDSRRILCAGYAMTAGMSGDELYIVRVTASGNPKADAVKKSDLAPGGRAVLYRSNPVPADDRRNMEPWDRW